MSLEGKIKDIEKMDMASILAANLKEQESCPVCGSMHHIKLAEKVDIKELEILKEDHRNAFKELENIKIERKRKKYTFNFCGKRRRINIRGIRKFKRAIKR